MIKLKVSKEKLLQWYADNNTGITSKQVKAYFYEDWESFMDYNFLSKAEKSMFEEYFEFPEPEPNYKDWIGEDCVFSDDEIKSNAVNEVHIGILIGFNETDFLAENGASWGYCMLKKDYVKLIKELSK